MCQTSRTATSCRNSFHLHGRNRLAVSISKLEKLSNRWQGGGDSSVTWCETERYHFPSWRLSHGCQNTLGTQQHFFVGRFQEEKRCTPRCSGPAVRTSLVLGSCFRLCFGDLQASRSRQYMGWLVGMSKVHMGPRLLGFCKI